MLKKNTPLKFTRPYSTMRSVLSAVEQGQGARVDIVASTGLHTGQVRSALYNLVYIGALIRETDDSGRSVYCLPGRVKGVAPCLRGVRSIFDVR